MSRTMNFNMAKFCMACLVGTAMVIGGSNALATQDTFSSWSGAGGDGDWNNVANWSSGSLDVSDGSIDPDDLVVPDPTTATGDSYVGGRINRGDAETDPPSFPLLSTPTTFFPVVTAATLPHPVVERFNLNTGNDSFDGDEALFTVDGGRVDVAGAGSGAALSMGRSVSKTLPVGSVPKSRLVIQNGGEFFVGSVFHPAINAGLLPSPPAGAAIRLGQSNIVVDGLGSKLVVSGELRYGGSAVVGKNPLPGSGIVVSNGGYLETGNLRLERLDGLFDSFASGEPVTGTNAGFLDIVGPGSSVMVFNAVSGSGVTATSSHDGETLLQGLLHLIDVDGVIVADGGAMTVGITAVFSSSLSSSQVGTPIGYLLTSVPEPSSVALLGMALVGFVVRRRR